MINSQSGSMDVTRPVEPFKLPSYVLANQIFSPMKKDFKAGEYHFKTAVVVIDFAIVPQCNSPTAKISGRAIRSGLDRFLSMLRRCRGRRGCGRGRQSHRGAAGQSGAEGES